MMQLKSHRINGKFYVFNGNNPVAIMERSPFTGEWSYGLNSGYTQNGQILYRPPFTSTQRKTFDAALKVLREDLEERTQRP